MIPPLRWLAIGLGLALLAAPPTRAAAPAPAVILISLDGTRPDFLRRRGLPAFATLLAEGASAERLTPAFPTNTFPNHVTLVTGVVPDRHGIVNNVFLDPDRGLYAREADPTWIEVEPLWSLASRQGVVCASYHWVGSEGAWRNGFGPRHWKLFDASVSPARKVDQILAWLDLPDPRVRPRLVTAWFPGADHVAHRSGPDSPQVTTTLRRQGKALLRLWRGLAERGLDDRTTLLVVSDHGMAPVERTLDLRAALEEAGLRARVFGAGGFATVVGLRSREDRERLARVARDLGLEVVARGDARAGLPIAHPRFGDAVVLAPPGVALVGRGPRQGGFARFWGRLVGRARAATLYGAHGYRPELPEMGAVLFALGRGAESGEALGRVRAVDVAPTVLALLGLPPPEWMEGRPVRGLIESHADGAPSPPGVAGRGSRAEPRTTEEP